MPRSSHPAIAIVNMLLLPLGLIALLVGVWGAFTVHETWWLFAVMALAGGGMMYGAAQNLGGWGRAGDVEDATTREMVAAAQAAPGEGAALGGAALAHWTYDPAEWRRYVAGEMRFRAREALMLGAAAFALVGAIVLVVERDWRVALMMSSGVGIFIALWRLAMAYSAYRRNAPVAHGEVIVGPTAMLVNGRYEVIEDGQIHFGGARVIEAARPAILEIVIMVPGKYRHMREEYRIPIPAGKEDEARALAAALERAHRPALEGTATRAALPGG